MASQMIVSFEATDSEEFAPSTLLILAFVPQTLSAQQQQQQQQRNRDEDESMRDKVNDLLVQR